MEELLKLKQEAEALFQLLKKQNSLEDGMDIFLALKKKDTEICQKLADLYNAG